ncbi:MAG: winged helix-turn-helix transcriptional regulator [Ignavibacteria bacterium]|jgi:DNA-binding transcriptional ArsR family regulator|nr:winged helix-turn-helix transcriptional regulator [Ignavibacteria bacterium]MCU7503042.1 winged helix-turn-helix transcriptional regulator [Ignavibacteria bacterium]MCU7516538.1 winged helix-turn-helix transcriptional regulator [Ignavibacteria bacterium]
MVLEEKAKLFKALSDPNRLRILGMLQGKKLCVCEITAVLDLAASTVSEHLRVLESAGFIIGEKDGKWMNYAINLSSSDPTVVSILSMFPFWISTDKTVTADADKAVIVEGNKLCCR